MHDHTIEQWQHTHDFAVIHEKGERRTTQVLVLTAVTMLVEIIAGQLSGSMALLADGWHMGTHVAAFAISIFAYHYARRHAGSPRFSFGTGKVSVLGGFASAVALVVVALVMALESIRRLFDSQEIHFNEAILVALLGLAVNLLCAALLQDHHVHDHAADGLPEDHDHPHEHHDHNLRAAYLHVLADALTSLLAIAALLSGKYLGWHWLDSIMGLVGAAVITHWSYRLVLETSAILLDQAGNGRMRDEIRKSLESDSDNRISDMHIWRVGPAHYSALISIVTHYPKDPRHYKNLLDGFQELSHVTVEVNACDSKPCIVSNEQ
jgi:cation diffusion facilitator family transporter